MLRSVFLSAFLLLSSFSQAQILSLSAKAGLSGGPMIVGSPYDTETIDDAELGFHGGFALRLDLPLFVGIKLDPHYNLSRYEHLNSTQDYTVQAGFLDIPFCASVKFLKLIQFDAGPMISVPLHQEITEGGIDFSSLYSDVTSPQYGYAIGIETMIVKNVGIYARYTQRFGSYSKTLTGEKARFNQHSTHVGLAYRIFGGKD